MVFILVFTRIAALIMTAPAFGSRAAPIRVRALLALAIALVAAPVFWNVAYVEATSLVDFTLLLLREVVLGVVMGLSVTILMTGFQVAGLLVGQMSGMSIADIFDPNFNDSTPLFARLMDLIATLVFVAIGGHRLVLRALLDTFTALPPGRRGVPEGIAEGLTQLLGQSFALGIRAAAPVLVAVLLSVLVMGLIGRTLPQLNILAVGFSLNILIMLATLSVSLGAIVWLLQDELGPTLDAAAGMLAPRAES